MVTIPVWRSNSSGSSRATLTHVLSLASSRLLCESTCVVSLQSRSQPNIAGKDLLLLLEFLEVRPAVVVQHQVGDPRDVEARPEITRISMGNLIPKIAV